MNNFKKLIVWQKSRELVKDMYIITKKFPKEELFGLTSQIRRATVSIALNIAEGSGRGTNIDFARFLDIAYGSAFEVEAQIILSLDLGFITNEEHDTLTFKIQEIHKMLRKLTDSLRKTQDLKTQDARLEDTRLGDTRHKTQDLKMQDLKTQDLKTQDLKMQDSLASKNLKV